MANVVGRGSKHCKYPQLLKSMPKLLSMILNSSFPNDTNDLNHPMDVALRIMYN